MSAVILTIIGRKGGCGKSTLCASLAGSLAKAKQRVLIVDLDGQASVTRSLVGVEHNFHPSETISALFEQPQAFTDIVHITPIDGIHLVPASDALDRFMIPHQGQNPGVLFPFFKTIVDQYDVILIDTAPNTNAWPTVTALTLSNWALTPVVPDAFGAHSMSDTLRLIQRIGRASFLGFVLTMIERNSVTTEYKSAIRKKYGTAVFKTEINKAVAFKDATASRVPVTHLTPLPPVAKTIDKLTSEISRRTAKEQRKSA